VLTENRAIIVLSMRTPFCFILLALAVCAAVTPGNLGSIDARRRLQVARWLRGSGPEVSPGDAAFGIAGRNGTRHAWFGIGQSLVLLPIDAVVNGAVSPFLQSRFSPEKREQVVELLDAFFMQFVITSFVLIAGYQVLLSFGFSPLASAAGVVSLLFGTTCLQYVQSAQENDLLLALDLGALWAIERWRRGSGPWASVAGVACGLAILTRLPSVLDAAVFALLLCSIGNARQFLREYLPPIVGALVIDRLYHWMRFGEFLSTYIGIYARQSPPQGKPPGFPFSYPFWRGFLGTLFSPDKSILLFDPLLLVLALVAVWRWRNFDRTLRITLQYLVALLVGYIALYAKYFDFGGDVAWAHRFVTVPVQLLALFAVPLLLTQSKAISALGRGAAWTLVAASVTLQLASTAIAPNLEVVQRAFGYDRGVVWNRVVNLAELASGGIPPSRAREVPIEWRSLYYLPFQLRLRFPDLAVWAIRGWLILVLCLPLLVIATLRAAAQAERPG